MINNIAKRVDSLGNVIYRIENNSKALNFLNSLVKYTDFQFSFISKDGICFELSEFTTNYYIHKEIWVWDDSIQVVIAYRKKSK
jgi:hypothetical protein